MRRRRGKDATLMPDITPTDRATAVFDADVDAQLRCSHCGGGLSDDDPECPTCESPIDWGASQEALRLWELRSRAD
jgi:hypothetical protein